MGSISGAGLTLFCCSTPAPYPPIGRLSCDNHGPLSDLELATFSPKNPVPVQGRAASAGGGVKGLAAPLPVQVVLQLIACPVLKSRYVPSGACVMWGQSCSGPSATSAKVKVLSSEVEVAWIVWQPLTSCMMVVGV